MNRHVVIIGGGLAGIAAAIRLAEDGHVPRILETRRKLVWTSHEFRRPSFRRHPRQLPARPHGMLHESPGPLPATWGSGPDRMARAAPLAPQGRRHRFASTRPASRSAPPGPVPASHATPGSCRQAGDPPCDVAHDPHGRRWAPAVAEPDLPRLSSRPAAVRRGDPPLLGHDHHQRLQPGVRPGRRRARHPGLPGSVPARSLCRRGGHTGCPAPRTLRPGSRDHRGRRWARSTWGALSGPSASRAAPSLRSSPQTARSRLRP